MTLIAMEAQAECVLARPCRANDWVGPAPSCNWLIALLPIAADWVM